MKKLFITILLMICISGIGLGQSTIINVPDDYATIQLAIDNATAGDIIQVNGTYVENSPPINVNLSCTIQGNGSTIIQTSGTTYLFNITSNDVTIKNLEIEKTDDNVNQYIIGVGADNFELDNCNIHAQFVMGDGEVTGGLEVQGSVTGLNIHDCEFHSIRQPGYFNNNISGTFENNYTYVTKGWVVVTDCNITFSNNTWGTGSDVNYYDIALINQSGSVNNYTDIVTISNNNNGAIIENQHTSYTNPILSIVHVDASATGGNGSIVEPYADIQSAIPRVAEGGSINVEAGTYSGYISTSKSLTLRGNNSGISASDPNVTRNAETIFDGLLNNLNASEIIVDGFTFTSSSNNLISASNGDRSNWQIINNRFVNSGGSLQLSNGLVQITAGDFTNLEFSNNLFEVPTGNPGRVSIFMWGSAGPITLDNANFDDNRFVNVCSPTSFWLNGGSANNASFANNVILDADNRAIQLDGFTNVNISGNEIDGLADSYAIKVTNGSGTITNNIIKNVVETGIEISGTSTSASISGNTFENVALNVTDEVTGGIVDLEAVLVNNTFDRAVVIRDATTNNIIVNNIYGPIQDAVVAAAAGDIINVSTGTYEEHVTISKSLTLQGENASQTVIDVSSLSTQNPHIAVEVQNGVNNVTIDNFTIKSKPDFYHSDDCCIRIGGSSGTNNNISLSNNIIDGYSGVLFKNGDSFSLRQNDITFNKNGIVVQTGCTNVDISDNALTKGNNIDADPAGIYITSTSGSITGNSIEDVVGSSDNRGKGITGSGNHDLLIDNNTINNTGYDGISMWGDTYNVTISDNILSNNAQTYTKGAGITIKGDDLTITGNNIYGSSHDGIIIDVHVLTSVNIDINNNNIYNNAEFGLNVINSGETVNAESNWWGTADETTIQGLISGDVDYSPWIGMEETSTVSTTSTAYSYPASGTTLNFSTLPSGGGTVTVKRYNTAPPVAPPAGATVAPIYFEITSSMANYTFNTTVVLDVTGISGFTSSTQVAYYNTTTSKWVFIPVTPGAYAAGPPATYTFTTDHFTTFSFINTPATAKNLYLASLATATSSSIIYPNDEWDGTVGNDDWDFQSPISLYIVPEAGTEFGACTITLQWNSDLFTFSSVDKTGGLFDGANFQFVHTQFGTTDQLIIDATTKDNSNFSVNSGEYIAQLNLNLVNPGYGTINITSEDFRNLDGAGGFEGVYMTPNNASVKSYLGDVAAIGTPTDESTGDGLVEIEDLSLWSSSYWYGVDPTATGYKVKYDVGPTSTNTVYGLPQPDSKIQFEDLVIFAMSYGLSGDNVYPKVTPVDMPVELYLGEPVLAGSETRIPVMVKGGVQNIRAMQLSFAGRFGKLLSVEKGALLTGTENPVMVLSRESGSNVYADFAFFGADEKGINTEGEILVLRFDGNAEVNISSAEVRNILNNEMGVELTGEENAMPTTFDLSQNYPNPFNPTTLIKYQLPEDRQVVLKVFNALGQQVTELVNEVQQAGYYEVQMNGLNMSSGVYFYHITAGDFTSVKKMMLIK